ncbi:MAG: response regulator [Hymenobacteraceae bacterium]|nr:response regulator [Hymenobacteraceae bacterium]
MAPITPAGPWTVAHVYPNRAVEPRSGRGLLEDRNGRVWLQPGDLVEQPDPTTGRWRRLRAGDAVLAVQMPLLEDRERNVWAGGQEAIEQYLPDQRFAQFTRHDGLPHPRVSCVTAVPGAPNRFWVGTDKGPAYLDTQAPGGTRLTAVRGPGGSSLGWIAAQALDTHGDLWLSTPNGLERLPAAATAAVGGAARFDTLPSPDGQVNGALSLALDPRGRVWWCRAGGIGGTANALVLYDPATRRSRVFSEAATALGGPISRLTITPDGRGWVIGDAAEGLLEVSWPAGAVAPRFRRVPGEVARPGFGFVNADSAGTLWLIGYGDGPESGLWRYDTRHPNARIVRCRFRGPTQPTDVAFVQPVAGGRLWIGAGNGLFLYSPTTDELRLRDASAPYKQFNSCLGSSAVGLGGQLWWGTRDGLICYDSALAYPNPVPPTPRLTGVKVFLRDTTLAPDFRLPHQLNQLTFDYVGISLTTPESVRYRSRLLGLAGSSDWTPPLPVASATFTNLPPGTYRFEVTAANNDGVWSRHPAVLAFTIAPPWWRTGWAYAAYALLLGAVIWGAYQLIRQRERERAVRRAEHLHLAHLQELNRVKSDFFTNISHEFRTPLTLIIGPAETLLADPNDPAQTARLSGLVARQARQLLGLINQILDLSKLEAGALRLHPAPEPDVAARVRCLVAQFASLADNHQLTLRCETPSAPVPLVCDAVRLDVVLTNLLANALKFTPTGGAVTVRVRAMDAGTAGVVEIEVGDTGPGIAAHHHAHLFERFYQVTDEAVPAGRLGSGVGLALARELVALQGGSVTVASAPGQGATFTVRLPRGLTAAIGATPNESATDQYALLSDEEPVMMVDSAEETPIPTNAPADAAVVLIVEDNVEVRAFIEATLAPLGYRLLLAPDGEAGLEVARAEVPDLIVSDVMMPRMDGYQLCNLLKTDLATSHIPVVLLTARASADEKVAGLETGADAFLAKPFLPRELQAQVRNLLRLRQLLQARFAAATNAQPVANSGVVRFETHHSKLENSPDPLVAHGAAVAALPSLDQEFLQRVETAVEEHLDDGAFGVEELAEAVFLGRGQLHRKLKALTGQAPSDYVRQTRLRRGHALLAARVGTVAEVSTRVGFNSPNYFSTCFSALFGYPPSEVPVGAQRPETAA